MSQSECETVWQFGAAGIWDESSQTCSCPIGFSGRDEWKQFQSCHVDELIATVLRIFAMASSATVILTSLMAYAGQAHRWNFAEKPKVPVPRRLSKLTRKSVGNGIQNSPDIETTQSSPEFSTKHGSKKYTLPIKDPDQGEKEESEVDFWDMDGQIEEVPEPAPVIPEETPTMGLFKKPKRQSSFMSHAESRRYIRDWRRKRSTLFVYIWFFGYGIASFVYLIPMETSSPTFRGNLLQNIGLALAAAQILCGFFAMVLAWYNTLPSVTMYGKLLKINPFFVRYPRFVYFATSFMSYVVFIGSLLLLVVIPEINESLADLCDRLFLVFVLVVLLLFLILATFVSASVKKIFRQMISVTKKKANSLLRDDSVGDDLATYESALITARLSLIGSYIAWIVATVSFALILINDTRYMYIMFNMIILLAGIACVVTIYIFSLRTDGGLAPGGDIDYRKSRRLSKLSTGTGGAKPSPKRRKTKELSKSSLPAVSDLELAEGPTGTTLERLSKKKLSKLVPADDSKVEDNYHRYSDTPPSL
mmetsp:Transcript_5708/g.6590  ORF Transcript_5708/g.6590 Transcript_5708/m.6590 type:complete len:534 (+) Transcript_5708:224-1825(+)|eukprot:CAMPEP_0184070754 /NCGR_PEP_ID=MMETSP0957-20130417/50908_1 /TAXON_ID=627963 /ORGANISM="Aplanochytrium sp, Strain PBS07" /LENGTH=533 /DNA_ID=CAMNT_0026370917 /DNA_START=138 /DNA_END=1739 /DNA_ORIENTATION=+